MILFSEGRIELIEREHQFIRTTDTQLLYMYSTPIYNQYGELIDANHLYPGDIIYAAFQAETSQYPLYIRIVVSVDESFEMVQETWVAENTKGWNDPIINNLGSENFWVRERATQILKSNKDKYRRALIWGSILCKDPEIQDRIRKIQN